jgi:phytoene synthase
MLLSCQSFSPSPGGRQESPALSISQVVGSSAHRAFSDDALKDEDNAAFVRCLAPPVREEWLRRLRWIRMADRLAENERLEPAARRFTWFCHSWRRFVATGETEPQDPHGPAVQEIGRCWHTPEAGWRSASATPITARAWAAYIAALADYHRRDLVLSTLADHDTMLGRLSGHLFQLIPFLSPAAAEAIYDFGALDQFMNNLRDLQEDASHGICYLPEAALAAAGVDRESLLAGSVLGGPGYRHLMRFWLDEHLPALRRRAAAFVGMELGDPSLELMRRWTLHRHARIERVLRGCGLDFRLFPACYWAEVRRDLDTWGVKG